MQPHVPPDAGAGQRDPAAPPFAVAFYLVPGFSMVVLSAAVEPLRAVNRLVRAARYRWRYQVTDRRLVSAIRLMEESLAVLLRIARIADVVGISERQLVRLFESAFGKKPSDFYMEIRLKQACLLLVQSTLSLEQIADITEFSSSAHFSRAYKAQYGKSPSSARRRDADGGIIQEVGRRRGARGLAPRQGGRRARRHARARSRSRTSRPSSSKRTA